MVSKKLIIIAAIFLVGFITSSTSVSCSYDKVIDTNLEYGVDVDDILVYNIMHNVGKRYFNEYEMDEMISIVKFVVINTTVFDGGNSANLTLDLYAWNNSYQFDLDEVDEGSRWEDPDRDESIVNNTLYSIIGFESAVVIPKDITVSTLIKNDTVDVFLNVLQGSDSISEFEDAIVQDLVDDDMGDIDLVSSVQADKDEPYGRVIYNVEVLASNSSEGLLARMYYTFRYEFKYNGEYGVFEELCIDMLMGYKIWDEESLEVMADYWMSMLYDYDLIYASNDAYMTEDFVPYWVTEGLPTWWSENWGWLVGILIAVPSIILLTWYFNTRANCDKFKDPKHSWVCGKTGAKK